MLKKELIETLKKIDSNNSKIIGCHVIIQILNLKCEQTWRKSLNPKMRVYP